jgi:hypothetical protein
VNNARAIADNIVKDAKLNGLIVPVAQQVDVNVSTEPSAIIDRMESELLALVAKRQTQTALGGRRDRRRSDRVTMAPDDVICRSRQWPSAANCSAPSPVLMSPGSVGPRQRRGRRTPPP